MSRIPPMEMRGVLPTDSIQRRSSGWVMILGKLPIDRDRETEGYKGDSQVKGL